MGFGENLLRIRKERGIRQMALARELGVTQQMISGYEKGLSVPKLEILVRMADYFDISLDKIVGRDFPAGAGDDVRG